LSAKAFRRFFTSSCQAKQEIATWTEIAHLPGSRPLDFDIFVTGDDPGAGGAVKQGVEERRSLRHPDILVETARLPPMSSRQKDDCNGGGQLTEKY